MNTTRLLATGLAVSIILLVAYFPCFGQSSVVLTADDQFRFAEHYFEQKKYAKAVIEYERFVYFFPKDSRVSQALFQVGESYFRANQFDDAVRSFQVVIKKFGETDLALKSFFRSSLCYTLQQQYGDALATLDRLLWTNPARDTKDEIYYRKGWIYLETDDWDKARKAFEQISPRGRETYGLQSLFDDMDKKDTLKTKSPRVAGFLAILPGAGHIYCERYQDALISLVINGGFMIAAWEAFENDNEALGALLTFFEIGFYSANIYSAVNSAHKYNRKQKNQLLQHLKENATLEASAVRWNNKSGLALTCNIRF